MPRIDDYNKAVELGRLDLAGKDPKRVADQSGALFKTGLEGGPALTLDFLNREVIIKWPDLDLSFGESGDEVPVQEQVLLLHYLNGSVNVRQPGKWIAYQEVPDGRFYLDAFLRRAKNPMVQVFGNEPELLTKVTAQVYGASPSDQGDVSVIIQALPKVPVALILWRGDEEFPPEGTILFDESISRIFSAEDIAWLAGMIIYPIIGIAKSGQP